MIQRSSLLILFFLFALVSGRAIGATIQSTATGGNWNVAGSWAGGVIPVAGDDVFIVSGSIISVTSSPTCTNLRIEGTLAHVTNNTTLSVSGNIILSGTGSITGNDGTRTINVTGNFLSETGADGSIAGVSLMINGITNLQGRVLFTDATGSKIFIGNVSVANGGAIDFSAIVTLILTGSLDMSGTSSIGNNTTISGNLVGVSSFIVNAGATAVIGRVNITVLGLSQFNGATTFTNINGTKSFVGGGTINNNGSLDFTVGATISFSNALTMNGTSSIGATSPVTGTINSTSTLVVSAASNATIGRVSLNIGSTSSILGNLLLSNTSGTKTLTGNVTVGAAGAINFSVAEQLDLGANLITNPGSVLGNSGTGGTINVVGNFTPVTGGASLLQGLQLLSIQGDFAVNNSAGVTTTNTNVITVGGNWNINNNATVDVSSGTNSISILGNWSVTSVAANPFVEGSSTVTFRSTTSLQTIASTETGGETFFHVTFNNTSGLATGISASANINARSITVTTGNIDMTGHDLTITGNASAATDNFTSGTIFSSLTGSDLVITDPSINKTIRFTGTTIGSASQPFGISVTSASIYFDGADFFANGTGTFTRTGPGDNDSDGGTLFTGNYALTQATGSGRWVMESNGPDIFTGNATLTNNSTSEWILERASTGNEFQGATIINNTSSGGFSFGRASGGNGVVRSALFTGSVTVNQSGSGTIIFATSSAAVGTNITFQSDILVSSTAGSSGSISFGDNAGGSITLTSTARFNIAAGSVLGSNRIILNRLTQNGTTLTQNITLSGTAILEIGTAVADGCTFNANLNFIAPELRMRYNTFNGTNSFTQTGLTGTNIITGGNTFASTTTFTNQGTKAWRLGVDAGDDFNGNVNFIRTGASLEPGSNNNSTFAGNISTVGSTAAITFATNNGRITMDGASAKTLSADVAFPPIITRLTMNGGAFTLNTPTSIIADLTFTAGVINTTATNLLTLNAGSTVSGTPSNTSHIDGPIKKIGNTAFTFPTGDSGFYRALGISAPTNAAHFFTAEFFRGSHPFTNAVATTLISVTRCEYWNLAQSSGGSNVSVTLNWNTPDCTPPPYITNPAGLAVTHWNGSLWANDGNGGTTGNATTGSVTSLAAVSAFGSFALGSTTFSNPLPIELLSFTADVNETSIGLLWSTASEHNNNYFTIQRSKEGHEFESIIQIPGAANGYSNQRQDYDYKDEQPFEGISYYRLKQTDFDGQSSLSKVIKVDRNQITRLAVYPNPAISTQIVTTNFTGSFQVFNAVGKLLLQARNTNSLNFNGFAPGVYLIRSDRGLSARLIID